MIISYGLSELCSVEFAVLKKCNITLVIMKIAVLILSSVVTDEPAAPIELMVEFHDT